MRLRLRKVFLAIVSLICLAIAGLGVWMVVDVTALRTGESAYQQGDYDTALRKWMPLAEGGFDIAQDKIGILFRDGNGVSNDDATAVDWFRRGAEQGHAVAQYHLAEMLYAGRGAPQNTHEALWWLERAGANGHSRSLGYLGVLYRVGVGLDQDPIESYKWYSLAIAANPDDEKLSELREQVRRTLSEEEIAEAGRRMEEWRDTH